MNKVLIFFLLLLTSLYSQAQVEVDTAVAPADTAVYDSEDEDEAATEIDTATYHATLRSVPDSVVNAMKRDEKFEYANDPAYWKKKQKGEKEKTGDNNPGAAVDNFFENEIVRSIVYILLGAVFLFILYRIIVVNNLFLSRRSSKLAGNTEEGYEEAGSGTIEDVIQKAKKDNNYRVAVRYYYLKTLQLLDEKGWIRYNVRSTNNDYLSQVSPYGHSKEFRHLTKVYDYVWYGSFELNGEQFTMVEENFLRFFKVLNP